jgi:hypothetical protein
VPVVQPVPVDIDIEEGLTLTILSATGTHVRQLSRDLCRRATCRLSLPPGAYTLRLRESASGDPVGESVINLDFPMSYRARRPHSAKTEWLVLAITGHVVSLGGLLVATPGFIGSTMCQTESGCRGDSTTAIGVAGILGGAVLSVVGWVMFSQARASGDDGGVVTPSVASQPRLTVSAAPLPSGATFAGAVRF